MVTGLWFTLSDSSPFLNIGVTGLIFQWMNRLYWLEALLLQLPNL